MVFALTEKPAIRAGVRIRFKVLWHGLDNNLITQKWYLIEIGVEDLFLESFPHWLSKNTKV